MRRFIYNYVDGCAICQSTKNLLNRPKAPLHPIPPEKDATPFATVSLDFITELPLSNGFDAIVVFVDHDVTKAVVIAPCHTCANSRTLLEPHMAPFQPTIQS